MDEIDLSLLCGFPFKGVVEYSPDGTLYIGDEYIEFQSGLVGKNSVMEIINKDDSIKGKILEYYNKLCEEGSIKLGKDLIKYIADRHKLLNKWGVKGIYMMNNLFDDSCNMTYGLVIDWNYDKLKDIMWELGMRNVDELGWWLGLYFRLEGYGVFHNDRVRDEVCYKVLDLLYYPKINDYRGNRSIEINMLDYR